MGKQVYITRRERFNAAHKLWNPEWDEQQNYDMFGKCSNPNWHGHNYEMHVTVKGAPDPVTGFVVNLKKVSQILKEKVVDFVDHRNLNLDVAFMKDIQPSTENLVIAIWEQIEEEVNATGCTLHRVRVYETENNYADYFGGN